MKARAYLIHALSPLHAGTGQAAEIVDLPIARMRSTGIPIVPGSSIKGVLRDAFASAKVPEVDAIFGPSTENAHEHAGALIVGDARLLALPVRSFAGTFAWVTSPLLLGMAARDLAEAGVKPLPNIPKIEGTGQGDTVPVLVPSATGDDKSLLLTSSGGREIVLLEELDLVAKADAHAREWADLISKVLQSNLLFKRRFAVVSDDTMAFLCDTALQLDTRVRIDQDSRTVAQGALWLEESLPPETLLAGLMVADRSRKKNVAIGPEQVLDHVLGEARSLQLGGKATVGRGRCLLQRF